MTRANVEYLLERRALMDRAIERAILTEERFGGDEDWENGSIIVADKVWGTSTYTYVFLKVRNGYWYSTSKMTNGEVRKTMTYAQLIDFLSECERVDYVTQLKEI